MTPTSVLLLVILRTSAGAGPGPVTLHFAWPANLQGSVKHTYSNRSQADHPTIEGGVEYRFAVKDAPGGLHRVVPSDVRYAPPASIMAVGEPSIVLYDDRGAFKGVEHTKGDLLDRMTDGPLPLPPEKKAEIRAQIEALQQSEGREKWDELTGRWNGITLAPGKPVKRTVKLGLGSILGRTEVDAVETTTFETEVACDAAALEKTCVRLELETVPAKALPRKPDPFGMIEISVTKRVIIVLEPGTLVPYSIHTERADLVEREARDDPKGKPTQTERYLQLDDLAFSYAPGARKL